jgi:hypothetical protein
MDIAKFKHRINNVARASLYEVGIVKPIARGIEWSEGILQFTAKVVSLPDSTFQDLEIPYMGRKIHFFGNRSYSTIDMKCFTTNNWQNYHDVYTWHRSMNHPQFNTSTTLDMNQYKTDVWFQLQTQIGKQGLVTESNVKMVNTPVYQLIGAFPLKVSPVELDWSSNDTADFTVTWCYDYADLVKESKMQIYGIASENTGAEPNGGYASTVA